MYSEELAIDINCSKLVEWLIQRRHCSRDWGEKLAIIRRKIRSALGDMPEHEEIKNILIGARIDYFKCKNIVEILKHTESNSKNFFGYYSSQRMKDWQDIVYQYEKNCIYLAEIATNLIREVSYEVPSIRKLISKLIKDREDVEKERANAIKRAQQFSNELNRLAQSYGIKGENVAVELKKEASTVFDVMNNIATKSKVLDKHVAYYKITAARTSRLNSAEFLSTLTNVINKGNITVYELKHGKAPTSVDRSKFESKKSSSAEADANDEIDIGDDEIDFGEEVDLPSSESSSGFVHLAAKDDQSRTSETGLENLHESKKDVAMGDETRYVLEYQRTRTQFTSNLHELHAFFSQLLFSIEAEKKETDSSFLDEELKYDAYSVDEANQVLLTTSDLISSINSERSRMMFQINESENYIDDIEQKFRKLRKQISTSQKLSEDLVRKIDSLDKEIKETQALLNKAVGLAKESQTKVEDSIRYLYNNRPINIMGGI